MTIGRYDVDGLYNVNDDFDNCLEVPSVGRGDKKAIEHPHTNLSSNNVFTNGNDLGDTGAEQ